MRSRVAAVLAAALLTIASGCGKDDNNSNPTGPGNESALATLKRITSGPAYDESPRWSPDGRKIAFVSDRGLLRNIWTMPDTGGTPVQITTSRFQVMDPVWSPDGSSFACVALVDSSLGSRDSLVNRIVKVSATTGAVDTIKITGAKLYFSGHLRWSPDGNKIAFLVREFRQDTVRSRITGEDSLYTQVWFPPNIWTVTAGGGGKVTDATTHRVTGARPRDALEIRAPEWSPDGSMIAFSERNSSGSRWGIYAAPAGGGALIPLFSENGEERSDTTDAGSLKYSPDGTKIAFTYRHNGRRTIGVIPAAGGTPIDLMDAAAGQDPEWAPAGYPAWSPDGLRLAYVSGDTNPARIWIVGSSGHDAPARLSTSSFDDYFDPQWSPDGKSIVFMGRLDGNADLWLATLK